MTGRVGAIVLAGGRSSRFGRDKLAAPVDGRPLLDHAIRAVQAVATDVVVVVSPTAPGRLMAGIRVVHDARPFEGPLAGVAAGLDGFDGRTEQVVIVAGDMPSLEPAVLALLLEALGPSTEAAVLGVSGGSVPLPMAVRRVAAGRAVRRLLADDERSLRALGDALVAHVVPEAVWRHDDPEGRTLRDVDTPADLA